MIIGQHSCNFGFFKFQVGNQTKESEGTRKVPKQKPKVPRQQNDTEQNSEDSTTSAHGQSEKTTERPSNAKDKNSSAANDKDEGPDGVEKVS